MERDAEIAWIRRFLGDLGAGTSELAPSAMRIPADAYCDAEHHARDRHLLQSKAAAGGRHPGLVRGRAPRQEPRSDLRPRDRLDPAPLRARRHAATRRARLQQAWREAGCDPHDLQIQGDLEAASGPDGRPDLAHSLEAVPEWLEAGATTANVVMSLFSGWKRAPAFFDTLAAGWQTQLERRPETPN